MFICRDPVFFETLALVSMKKFSSDLEENPVLCFDIVSFMYIKSKSHCPERQCNVEIKRLWHRDPWKEMTGSHFDDN